MIADDVPLVYHSCDKSGFCLNIRERAEKCGGHIFLLENVEHGRCVSVLPAAVEGEIEHLFFSLCVYRDGVKAVRVKIFLGVHRVLMRNAVFGYAVAVSDRRGREPARVLRVGCGQLYLRQRGEPGVRSGVRIELAFLRFALRQSCVLGCFCRLRSFCDLRRSRCLVALLTRNGRVAVGGVRAVVNNFRFARAQRDNEHQREREA